LSCPICAKKTDPKHRPFCSARCKDVDLSRWLRGDYAVPSREPADVERAEEEVENIRRKPH
jgi:endogenous inhibitor of DNA gyrase (YacG/DUF329 family)